MKRTEHKARTVLGSLLTALILAPPAARARVSSNVNLPLQSQEGRDCVPEPTDMTIAYGDVVTCFIDPVGDTDLYRFTGVAGEVVSVRSALVGGLGRTLVELFDPDNSQVGTTAQRVDARLTKTGTYTIRASGGGTQSLRYVLSLERITPPSPSAAPLPSGQTITAQISPQGDIDLYFFRGAPGDQITLTAARQGGLGVPVVELFDPEGRPIGQPGQQVSARVDKMGVHTVRLAATTDPHSFTYTLMLQCTGQCPPPEDTSSKLTLPLVSAGQSNEGIRHTAFVVVNPSAAAAAGTLDLVRPDGATPLSVTIGNTTASQFPLSIPAGGAQVLETKNITALVQGYAKVSADAPVRAGAIIRSLENDSGAVVFQTSYGAPASATALTVLADSTGEDTDSGLVILNHNNQPANVTLTLATQSGQQSAQTTLTVGAGELSRGPGGEVIRYMTELFSAVPGIREFTGTITVASSLGISILAVQKKNDRLTILPTF
jgi:hypothetical protein